MSINNIRFLSKVISHCFLFVLISVVVCGQSAKQTGQEQAKLQMASEAADQFITRFRATLDFGVVFDEMASSRAEQVLHRGSSVFSFDKVDLGFLRSSDAKAKARLFKAEMNFYYIRGAYDATFVENQGNPEKEHVLLPVDVKSFIKRSKFLKELFDENTSKDNSRISTKRGFKKYIEELEHVTILLKKHLPRNYFETDTYQASLQEINRSRKPRVDILQGSSALDISDDTEVFIVTRDLFSIYFIQENGQMKVLALGIGN